MRDAPVVRRHRRPDVGFASIGLLGLFGLFHKKAEPAAAPRVIIDPPPAKAPPAAPVEPPMDPLRRDLRYKGLHVDVNPAASVRPGEMTCPNCQRTFRYFQNTNGVLSVVHCPGCTRAYRV